MNVMTSRFGPLEISEQDSIQLTEGPVGFRNCTKFVLLADQKVEGLYWLQSLESPELAFALVPPGEGLENYHLMCVVAIARHWLWKRGRNLRFS